jgi:hypothetical protein
MASSLHRTVLFVASLVHWSVAFSFTPSIRSFAKAPLKVCVTSALAPNKALDGRGEAHLAFSPSSNRLSQLISQGRRSSLRGVQTHMSTKGDLTFFPRVTVLGGGNFGLALALVLGQNNIPVTVLVRFVRTHLETTCLTFFRGNEWCDE